MKNRLATVYIAIYVLVIPRFMFFAIDGLMTLLWLAVW